MACSGGLSLPVDKSSEAPATAARASAKGMIAFFMVAPWTFALKFGCGVRKLERPLAGLVTLLCFVACSREDSHQNNIVVFAAASLTEVVADVAQIFETTHPDTRIRTNFAGSQQLSQQIAQGAQADIFATADERWMDFLMDRGFARGKKRFATTRLVVVARKELTFSDIAKPNVAIIVGAEVVPVGYYTRHVFSRIAAAVEYGPDFARAISRNIVSEEDNVRGVFAKVLLGEADAGFVYETDVRGLNDPAYHAIPIPDELNLSAEYFVARTTGTNNVAAETFFQILTASAGQRVLRARGFSPG